MLSRADSSVFWPGNTLALKETRWSCNPCNKMAPSQASMPPAPPTVPEYPFQLVCADYFHYMGSHYLITVDRYTNWPRVEQGADGCQGLVVSLRRGFMTFGIAEEISSDGGPEFVAFKDREVPGRLWSPSQGIVCWLPSFQLQGQSWCEDSQKTHNRKHWSQWVLGCRQVRNGKLTRQLPQLKVGDTVRIQNQTGNYPRWDKTGRIVEVRQHDQYMVRVDGSGRATLRNCLLYTSPSPRD